MVVFKQPSHVLQRPGIVIWYFPMAEVSFGESPSLSSVQVLMGFGLSPLHRACLAILFYFCQSCTQIFDLLLVWNLSVSLVLSDCKTGSLPLVAPPDVVIFQHRELNTASCAQHIPFCFLGSFPELFHEHLPHSLAAS